MKKLKYWHLCLAIWLGIASVSCAQNKVTFELAEDEKLIEFTTDRFTLPSLHVTPDGKHIIFDVLGDIYKVLIEDGKAELLLQDNNWKRAGKLSPDGKTLAYISDETGVFQVWTIDLETKEKQVYPIKESGRYALYFYWINKKQLLIPSKDGLQSFDINTGNGRILRPVLENEKTILHTVNRTMSVNKSGGYAFFQKNKELWAYDLNKNIDLFIEPIPEKAFLEFIRGTANGEKVLFYKSNKENDTKLDLVSWNLTTNKFKILNTVQVLKSRTSLNFNFDFIDNSTIVLDKEGTIVRMDIETGEYEPIPINVEIKKVIKKPLQREPQHIKDSIITASVLRNPTTRANLDTIYFGAFGKLHSFAKKSQKIMEVYPKEHRFEISPSLSPDGKYLAYTTWNDTEMGHIYVRELKTGKDYQLTQTPGRYINPAWSSDGTEIVFVADETEAKMGIPKQSGGTNTYYYHLDLHRIKVSIDNKIKECVQSDTIFNLYTSTNLPRRFYPIPVYHPKGNSIYITTRNHEKDLPVLIQIDLNTKTLLQEKLIPFHAEEVLISPDAKHIAFIFDEQVWVDRFPHSLKLEFEKHSEFIPERLHYMGAYINNILLPEAKSVYEIAPSYLSWKDNNTVMWGSAEEVYTYDIRTRKTKKIADIKVQKPRAVPKTEYALTDARIITMNKQDEIIERGTILIKDNRIETLGKTDNIIIPKHYKVISLEGKTIIPGLIDVHVHNHHHPYEFPIQKKYNFLGSLAYGVTTTYDPSINTLDYKETSQNIETGRIIGPRSFASGNPILDAIREADYKKIDNKKDSDRLVKSLIKLKIHGPIKEYDISNKVTRNLLAESSRAHNIGISSHHDSYYNAISRIIYGFTSLEHEIGNFPIQKDVSMLLGKSKVHYTPTYTISPGVNTIYGAITKTQEGKLLRFNGELIYNNKFNKDYYLEKPTPNGVKIISPKSSFSEYKRRIAIKNLVSKTNNKVKVSAGGHSEPLAGISTHWELWFMTRAMSNYQALQAATINGADKLDLQEEIGSIESGKLADIIVLNSNPLDDIFNTIDIFYTILNGNIFNADYMEKIDPN